MRAMVTSGDKEARATLSNWHWLVGLAGCITLNKMKILPKLSLVRLMLALLAGLFFVFPLFNAYWMVNSSRTLSLNNWLTIIFVFLFFSPAGFYLVSEAIKSCFLTELHEAGLRQKCLFGKKFVPWADVKKVAHVGFSVQLLYGDTEKKKFLEDAFTLTPTLYANWPEVALFIKSKVEPGVFQLSEPQIQTFK